MTRALLIDQAASVLNISTDDLFDLVYRGKIPYYKGFHTPYGFMFLEHEILGWKYEKLKSNSDWITQTLADIFDGQEIDTYSFMKYNVVEKYLDRIERVALIER